MSVRTPEWALYVKGGGGGGAAGESENASVGGPGEAAVPLEGGAAMAGDTEDRLEACQLARFGSEACVPVAVILGGLRDAPVDPSCCASAGRLRAVVGSGLGPGGGGVTPAGTGRNASWCVIGCVGDRRTATDDPLFAVNSDACIAGVSVSREALRGTVAGGGCNPEIGGAAGNSVSVVGDRSLSVVDDACDAEGHAPSLEHVRYGGSGSVDGSGDGASMSTGVGGITVIVTGVCLAPTAGSAWVQVAMEGFSSAIGSVSVAAKEPSTPDGEGRDEVVEGGTLWGGRIVCVMDSESCDIEKWVVEEYVEECVSCEDDRWVVTEKEMRGIVESELIGTSKDGRLGERSTWVGSWDDDQHQIRSRALCRIVHSDECRLGSSIVSLLGTGYRTVGFGQSMFD